MKRVRLTNVCLITLISSLALFSGFIPALAQFGQRQFVGPIRPRGKPFISTTAPLPKEVTRKAIKPGRAPIPPQTVDITPNTPTVDDRNPFWSRDEQTIVFDSNRTNLVGTQAGTLYHIYQMGPTGGGVRALTGPLASPAIGATASQTDPALNPSGSSLVYIETDPGGGVDIVELNLTTRKTRSLVRNNPNRLNFADLDNPEYGLAIGGNIGVIFAGRLAGEANFHLYTVDTQSGEVTQLTSGIADDRHPTISPDPARPVIAFQSNRANAAGTAVKSNIDIWVIGINPNIQNARRVTDFSVSGQASENIQPAWSTNKVDQPAPTGQRFVNGQQLIGFASTRYDSKGDGNPDGINPNGSHDIYWLKVDIGPDPDHPSVFTLTRVEQSTNPAIKLDTSDPEHKFDDRHPTWPQFINTYRVAYMTDRSRHDPVTRDSGEPGQPHDIFTSVLLDLNSPTLVRFDKVTGEIVRVEPRLATPGNPVKISVKVADLESGVRDVWVQIKNPNSKYQSSDGQEHKVYVSLAATSDGNNTALGVPTEYESQRIFIGADPTDPRVNTYANPTYIASVDDFYAFSGFDHDPEEGWLQLQPDPSVPRDADGAITYTATWVTDIYPTDYYIDVIVYDNAVDPFSADSSNWKIYDNVWGFTTQPFQAAHNLLFVSDYAAGQKFFASRFGTSALVNVVHTFWGTESWMTDIDLNLLPTQYVSGTTVGSLVLVLNALGVKSYGALDPGDFFTFLNYDSLTIDGTKAEGNVDVPATQQYDLWRILCRGPIPDSVLAQYTPRIEQQPPDTLAGETQPRNVLVAPRCVFWHAPYTGNLFAGPGTLTDIQVQNQLASFVAAGGRLFVNGQDVAWALTLNGSAQNTFFNTVLRAQFRSDYDPGALFTVRSAGFAFPTPGLVTATNQLAGAGEYNPISRDPWRIDFLGGHRHNYPGPPDPPLNEDYINNEPLFLYPGIPGNTGARTYACPGVVYPDHLAPSPNAIADITYSNGDVALQHYEDASTGQRVAFCACGIEGINPEWFNPPNTQNILALKNRRTELLHNIACYMRTGSCFGVVRDLEAGSPLPNTLVRLIKNRGGQPAVWYTALTGEDGSFTINGVESDVYEVTAFKPGYIIQKRTSIRVHGAFRNDISFRMTAAEPAVIKGKVTRTDGTTPVIGAVVEAKDNLDPAAPVLRATTDADGNYAINRVPSQTTYTLTCKADGFGESIPLSYPVPNPNDPIPGQRDTVVQAAKTYVGFDFQLKPEQGAVTGRVFERNADGSRGAPIAGATVTATLGSTNVTAVTDANGSYSFDKTNTPPNGLDPGTWGLVATAPGYAPNTPVTVTVTSSQTATAADILLSRVPPGIVSGLVTRTSDGAPLEGVRITLKDPAGNTVATATTGPIQNASDGYRYNYRIENAPAGVTYTVTATRSGFTSIPASRSAAVTSAQETRDVNFEMEPLHTFAAALSLVSAPFDYVPTDAGDLLSIPPADRGSGTFLFTSWDLKQYVYYPSPPANTFRLGRGYFLAYKSNIPLSTEGKLASINQPFDIPLNTGWNMIGAPFYKDAQGNLIEIDWTKVKVIYGGATLSYDQAIAQGLIAAALYSYVSGTYVLDFKLTPWRGYWVRAYNNVVLRMDARTDRFGRAAKTATTTSRAVLYGGDGWSVNLRARVGDVRDEDNHFGVTSRAVDGFDRFKLEKPPLIGDRYVYLTFDHTDWGDKSGGYGVDVRSATTATKTWEFTVQTNVANSTASLSWPNLATASRKVSLTLTDLSTGQVRDMRTTSVYNWQTGDKPASRRFKIEARMVSANEPLRITGITVRGDGRSSGSVAVTYNLSAAADVEVRILGASGNPVRRLKGRATRAAGIQQETWDLRDDRGIAMPAGSYLMEIRAQTPDGKVARAVMPLTLVR